MEFFELDYDPLKDVCEVDQFGFVDLAEAFQTGTIASNLTIEDLTFTEIDDPKAVSGKPRNTFEFIDAGVAIAQQEGVQSKSSAKTEGGD